MFRHKELLQAITNRSTSLAKEILATKPSVESKNEKGFNALQLAIKNDMTEIIEDILSLYKSNILLTDNLSRDFLHLAIKRSNLDIIKMILNKIGTDKVKSPLYLKEAKKFIKSDKGKVVYDYLFLILIKNLDISELIKLSVDINVILNRIEKDDIKIDLCTLGDIITYHDTDYFIPLYNIAKKQGLDVNGFIPDVDWTLLSDAIYEDKFDIVKFLCDDPDIDVNKGSETETPFYMACQHCRDDVFDLLYNRGANLNARPIGDKPALFYFLEYGPTPDMIEDIIEKGLRADEIYRDDNILQYFIKYWYSPHNDDIDTIGLLIEYVDIDHQDSAGNTVLVEAVKKEYEDVVGALVEAGADPNIKNKNNRTVYDYASPKMKELLPEEEISANVLYEKDPRVFTKQFNLKVFDIVNFEEVELNEFVKIEDNIVYFIRDESNGSLSSYGITRKNLRKCSKNVNNRCAFPTGHTINVDEIFKFTIEDFTLYQLTKTNVKCFTCQKFEESFY